MDGLFPPLTSKLLQGRAYFTRRFSHAQNPVCPVPDPNCRAGMTKGQCRVSLMAGLMILLLKSVIGMLHSTSMYVGELADFIMGAALVLPSALIYRRKKTRKSAVIGMAVGTLVLVVVGVLVNWKIMLPFYMTAYGMPMEKVIGLASAAVPLVEAEWPLLPFVTPEWKLLLLVTGPFNLLKGAVLSFLTYLMYKRLSPLLHVKGAAQRSAN